MAVTGGVGHGSGTCYRGTAESGMGQTCREVSETRRDEDALLNLFSFFFFLLYILWNAVLMFLFLFWWKIGCAMLQ